MPRQNAGRLIFALAALGAAVGACGSGPSNTAAPTPGCITTIPGPDGSPSAVPGPCVAETAGQPTTSPSGTTTAIEEWDGEADISSTAVYPSPDRDTCQDGWTLNFSFSVDGDGTVQGSGTGDLTSPPVCPFMVGTNPADLSWRNIAFKILGNRSAGAAELRFALVDYEPAGSATMAGFSAMFGGGTIPDGGASATIPIVGRNGVAPGSWQFDSGNPAAVYSATGTISINCTACD